MDELLLLIVCSPSGAGKTTLTRRLLAELPELTFSVSHTTRGPRANEVQGKDYHFIPRETFEGMVARGEFAEWAEVHGNFYGTSSAEIARAKTEGKRGVVFDIDYQGARQIQAKFKEAVGVFILPLPAIATAVLYVAFVASYGAAGPLSDALAVTVLANPSFPHAKR